MNFHTSALILAMCAGVDATSIKMDFLPFGAIRTDPLLNPTCLSDHVHTMYGAKVSVRPELTYDDMRQAPENSGNTEENMSLYWHPSVYMHDKTKGTYELADIWFGSSYYVFETGSATAFPNGFNMIAYGSQAKSRSEAICDGPSACERDDCSTSDASFFPQTACSELEAKIVFPTCWDGVNLVSDDMMSHVSYDIEEGRFDADCPTTHPVKLPEVHFYFRIANYKGGEYTFSSGSSVMHADYFSGWDQTKLQSILDGCSNDSDAASPDQFCEDFLTFRQTKVSGVQTEDDQIRTKLEAIQLHPNPDMKKTVSAEPVDNIASLVRGSCTGTLCPVGGCVGGDDSGNNSGGDADNSGGDTDGESESASDLADGGDGSSVKVGAGALALSVLLSMMFAY